MYYLIKRQINKAYFESVPVLADPSIHYDTPAMLKIHTNGDLCGDSAIYNAYILARIRGVCCDLCVSPWNPRRESLTGHSKFVQMFSQCIEINKKRNARLLTGNSSSKLKLYSGPMAWWRHNRWFFYSHPIKMNFNRKSELTDNHIV